MSKARTHLLTLACFFVACGGKTQSAEDNRPVTDAGNRDASAQLDASGSSGGSGGSGGSGPGGSSGSAGANLGGASGHAGTAGGGTGGAVNDAGSDSQGSQTCNITVGYYLCDECIAVRCEDPCIIASSEPDFSTYLTCASYCQTQACVDACAVQYPVVAQALADLDGCMVEYCSTACAARCELGTQDPTCNDCLNSLCGKECEEATDPGIDYIDCLQACSDEACAADCDAAYPEAVEELTVLEDCLLTYCEEDCPSLQD